MAVQESGLRVSGLGVKEFGAIFGVGVMVRGPGLYA